MAAEWIGWTNIVSCEINPFGRKVLSHYWPDAYHHDDIHTLTYQKLNNELQKRFGANWRTDDIVLSGGFPCQPYSAAGKRKGTEDDRHLWPEMLRAIQEISPRWVVGENVRGLTNWNGGLVFDQVQADLEDAGYEVLPFILPACAVNAPHRRDRVWFVAHAISSRAGSTNREAGDEKRGAGEDWRASIRQNYRETSSGRADTTSDDATDPHNSRLQAKGAKQQAARIKQYGELDRDAANTNNDGHAGSKNRQSNSKGNNRGEARTDDAFQSERRSSEAILSTPHPNSFQRPKGRLYQAGPEEAERHLGAFRSRNDWRTWEDFPTQSPVCGRDDGLPTGLDGITFSKWRNESIKAYGNAIVPQVAFQIFKAIVMYESKLKHEWS